MEYCAAPGESVLVARHGRRGLPQQCLSRRGSGRCRHCGTERGRRCGGHVSLAAPGAVQCDRMPPVHHTSKALALGLGYRTSDDSRLRIPDGLAVPGYRRNTRRGSAGDSRRRVTEEAAGADAACRERRPFTAVPAVAPASLAASNSPPPAASRTRPPRSVYRQRPFHRRPRAR